MPEIPTRGFYDESTEISEDPYSQTVRRFQAAQSMQESYLGEVSRIRAQQREQSSRAAFYQTLDAMTARYMRDFDISSVRGLRECLTPISEIESNLKVLAKKEKKINENKPTNR